MRSLWDLIVGFGRFWYGFVIGDDWMAAAGVMVMVGGAYGLLQAGVAAWWFGPVAILATATYTIRRALYRTTDSC